MTAIPIGLPTARGVFDPPPELDALRDERPVCRLRFRGGRIGWLVTSHELARQVLADSRFALRPRMPHPVVDPEKFAAVDQSLEREGALAGNLLCLDPPQHTRIRRLLARPFASTEIDAHAPRITSIVSQQLNAMERAGPPAHLVAAFASPVALYTHCAVLGVPDEDSALFARLHASLIDPGGSARSVIAAYREFSDYLRPVIDRKRRQPADDLMTVIASSADLRDDEVFSLVQMLFLAGHDTTTAMLALGTLALLCHPAQLELLRANPALIDSAVDELLRYLTIFQVGAFTRTAREDVELAGTLIAAGESVTVSLAAANRDPDKYDNPELLDVTRRASGHLSFGHGPHLCLGHHLARLELRIGFTQLLRRFPELRLAVPLEEVPLYPGDRLVYAVDNLPVAW